MRRRQFLATGGALLAGTLAGCAHPSATLEIEAVDDATLAERASVAVDTYEGRRRRLLRSAITNGTATVSGTAPPVEPDRPVAYRGAYYRLDHEPVDERTATQYAIEVNFDPESTDGPAVAFDDLPQVDRAALGAVLPPGEGHPTGGGYDVGFARVYTDAEVNASVLVPEPDFAYVSYEGKRYGVRVSDPRTVTVTDYRYAAERIAATTNAFAAWVKDRYLFVLSGLSASERDLFERAVDEGYHAGDPSEAFRSLAARFRSKPGFDTGEYGGSYVVRHDGTVYWVELYWVGFATTAE